MKGIKKKEKKTQRPIQSKNQPKTNRNYKTAPSNYKGITHPLQPLYINSKQRRQNPPKAYQGISSVKIL